MRGGQNECAPVRSSPQERDNLVAVSGVEGGGRLVSEHISRAAEQGSGDRQPLLLASAENSCRPVEGDIKTDFAEGVQQFFFGVLLPG